MRTFDPFPFDTDAAQAFGRVYVAVTAKGRKARGRRAMDLLIAASALSLDLPLFTCNPADLDGLGGLIEIVPVDVDCGGRGLLGRRVQILKELHRGADWQPIREFEEVPVAGNQDGRRARREGE